MQSGGVFFLNKVKVVLWVMVPLFHTRGSW